MTVELIDGFDTANTNASLALKGWTVTGTWVAAPGRGGQGSAMRANFNGANTAFKQLPGGNLATRVVGIGINYRTNAFAALGSLFSLRDGATAQINVWQAANEGRLIVRQNATTLGTSPIIWTPAEYGAFKFIELVSTIDNTNGSFELFVDNVSVLSGTNLDTQGSANAFANRFYIDGQYNGASDVDDLYIGSTRLGIRSVRSRLVTSNAAAAWTPSAGTNYQNVSDATLDTTTYNQASAAGLRDQFVLADLGFTPSVIDAISVNMLHTKTDAGARTIRAGVVSGASTANGATVSPTEGAYVMQQDVFAVDPATGVAWTGAGIDALQPFYETVT